MNKSILLATVFAIQMALFIGIAIFGSSVYTMSAMEVENWAFGLLIAFVVLGYFYMGIEFGFAGSEKISEGEKVKAAFNSIDMNEDDVISRKEAGYWARLARIFDQFDSNKDGRLSPEEFYRAFTCGLLKYNVLSKLRSFITLGLAPAPSEERMTEAPAH